jgi:hypothetical protein
VMGSLDFSSKFVSLFDPVDVAEKLNH